MLQRHQKRRHSVQQQFHMDSVSVVDPDPIGRETFSRIRIRKKSFRIRIRREFEVKLQYRKIWKNLTISYQKCSI